MGRGITTTLCTLAVATVAGCGGGSGEDDEANREIEQVLETAFTTSDPIQCDQITLEGIRDLSPSVAEADDPIAECRKSLDAGAEADSVEISDVSVDGSEATAVVTSDGGSLAGTRATISLADEDGWKLNGIDTVELIDREAYLAELEKRSADSFGNEAFTAEEAGCITEDIAANASDEELEASLAEQERGFVYDAVRSCLGGGTDLIAITTILRNQLVAEGVSPKQADCIAGASIAGQKGATLEGLAESREVQERIADAAKEGALICAGA
jgi:hypothetical protein